MATVIFTPKESVEELAFVYASVAGELHHRYDRIWEHGHFHMSHKVSFRASLTERSRGIWSARRIIDHLNSSDCATSWTNIVVTVLIITAIVVLVGRYLHLTAVASDVQSLVHKAIAEAWEWSRLMMQFVTF